MNQDKANRKNIPRMPRKTSSINASLIEKSQLKAQTQQQQQGWQEGSSRSINSEWTDKSKFLKSNLSLCFPAVIKQAIRKISTLSRQQLVKADRQIMSFLQNQCSRIQKVKQDNKIEEQLDNQISLGAMRHAINMLHLFQREGQVNKSTQRVSVEKQIDKLLAAIDLNIQDHHFSLAKSNINNLLRKHAKDQYLKEKLHYLSYIAKLSEEYQKQLTISKDISLFLEKFNHFSSNETTAENSQINHNANFKGIKKEIVICTNKENKKTQPSQRYIQFLSHFDRLTSLVLSLTQEKGQRREKSGRQLQLQRQLKQKNRECQWMNEAGRYCRQLLEKHGDSRQDLLKQLQGLRRNKKKSSQAPYSLIARLSQIITLFKRSFNQLTLNIKATSSLYLKKNLTLQTIAAEAIKSQQKYLNNELIPQIKPFLDTLILNVQERQRWNKELSSLELQNKKIKSQISKLSMQLQQSEARQKALTLDWRGQVQLRRQRQQIQLQEERQEVQVERAMKNLLKNVGDKNYKLVKSLISSFVRKYQFSQHRLTITVKGIVEHLLVMIEQTEQSKGRRDTPLGEQSKVQDNLALLHRLLANQQNQCNYLELLQANSLKNSECMKVVIECCRLIINSFAGKAQQRRILQLQTMKKYVDQIYRLTQLVQNHNKQAEEEILICEASVDRKSGSIKPRGSHPKQKQSKVMQKYVEQERVMLKRMEQLLSQREYEKKRLEQMERLLHQTEERFRGQIKQYQKKIYEYQQQKIGSINKQNDLLGLLEITQHEKDRINARLQLQSETHRKQLQTLNQQLKGSLLDRDKHIELLNQMKQQIQRKESMQVVVANCKAEVNQLNDQISKFNSVYEDSLRKLNEHIGILNQKEKQLDEWHQKARQLDGIYQKLQEQNRLVVQGLKGELEDAYKLTLDKQVSELRVQLQAECRAMVENERDLFDVVREQQLIRVKNDYELKLIEAKMKLSAQSAILLQKQKQQLQLMQQLGVYCLKQQFEERIAEIKSDLLRQHSISMQSLRLQLHEDRQRQIDEFRTQLVDQGRKFELQLGRQRDLVRQKDLQLFAYLQHQNQRQQIQTKQRVVSVQALRSADEYDILLKQIHQSQQQCQLKLKQMQDSHQLALSLLNSQSSEQLQQTIYTLRQQYYNQTQSLKRQHQTQSRSSKLQQVLYQEMMKKILQDNDKKSQLQMVSLHQQISNLHQQIKDEVAMHRGQTQQLVVRHEQQLEKAKQQSYNYWNDLMVRLRQRVEKEKCQEIELLKSQLRMQEQDGKMKHGLQLQLSTMPSQQKELQLECRQKRQLEQAKALFQQQKQVLLISYSQQLRNQLSVQRQKWRLMLDDYMATQEAERINLLHLNKEEKEVLQFNHHQSIESLRTVYQTEYQLAQTQLHALLSVKEEELGLRLEAEKAKLVQSNQSYISFIVGQEYKLWEQSKIHEIQTINKQHQMALSQLERTLNEEIINYQEKYLVEKARNSEIENQVIGKWIEKDLPDVLKKQKQSLLREINFNLEQQKLNWESQKQKQWQNRKLTQMSALQMSLRQNYEQMVSSLQLQTSILIQKNQQLSRQKDNAHQAFDESTMRAEWQKAMQLQWQKRVADIEDYWERVIVPQRLQISKRQSAEEWSHKLGQIQERFRGQIIPQLLDKQKEKFLGLIQKSNLNLQSCRDQNRNLLSKISELQALLTRQHKNIGELYQKQLDEASMLTQKQAKNLQFIARLQKDNQALTLALNNKDRDLVTAVKTAQNQHQQVKSLETERFALQNRRSSAQYDLLAAQKALETARIETQAKQRQVAWLNGHLDQQKKSLQFQFKISEKQRLDFQIKLNDSLDQISKKDDQIDQLLNKLKEKQELQVANKNIEQNLPQKDHKILCLLKQNKGLKQQIQRLQVVNESLRNQLEDTRKDFNLPVNQIDQSRINSVGQFSHQTVKLSAFNGHSNEQHDQDPPQASHQLPKSILLLQKHTNNVIQHLTQQSIIPNGSRLYDSFNIRTKKLFIEGNFNDYFVHWQDLLNSLFRQVLQSRFSEMWAQADELLRLRAEMRSLIEEQIEVSEWQQDCSTRVVLEYKGLLKEMKSLVSEYVLSKDEQQLQLICAILGVTP